jgi:hypothetical protein
VKLKVSILISAGAHEADVLVLDHGLDLEPAVGGNQDHDRLRRSHHPAHGMDGDLLHHAVDGRGQGLAVALLLGLHQLLREAPRLLVGLREVAQDRAAVLGLGLAALLDDGGNRVIGLAETMTLHLQLLLVLGIILGHLQAGELRADLFLVEVFPRLHPLAQHGERPGELLDR